MKKNMSLEKTALEYATHASKAPDKETPDWIITDFKAGAKWQRKIDSAKLNEAEKILEKTLRNSNRYIPIKLKREILDYLGLPF